MDSEQIAMPVDGSTRKAEIPARIPEREERFAECGFNGKLMGGKPFGVRFAGTSKLD
jgi:hypothetical protein